MEEHSKQHKMKARKYYMKTKCQPLFTCDECGLKAHQEDVYIEHVSTHCKCHFIKKESNILELKPHGTFCLKFEKDFGSSSMLKKHFAEKHTENHFTCDKCGVSYSSKYTLWNHISIEHEGTRITCERPKCGMTFKCKDQYKTHILKHDGKAVFTCSECMKGFYNRNHFQSHLDSHKNNRKHMCPKCGKLFLYSHDVPKHLNICGVTENQFFCSIGQCKGQNKGFKTLPNLQSHHKGYHKLCNVFFCVECGFQTFHETSYRAHMKMHK